MSKIMIIFIYIFGFYLLVVFFLFFFQRSLLYLPVKEKIEKTDYSNTGLKKVHIKTADGLILKSLYKKPNSQTNKLILLFHGNAGNISHRIDKFSPFLKFGYGMLFLEYRGYGENLGTPNELGLNLDAQAALNFLYKKNFQTEEIILYGESLGTGIAAKLSSENKFNATILEAPFTSIADVAQQQYWMVPSKWLVLDRYDILSIIDKNKSPLLVIHGYKDAIINIKFGKKVFNAAPNPKEAIFVPGAGHNNLFEFDLVKKIQVFLLKY